MIKWNAVFVGCFVLVLSGYGFAQTRPKKSSGPSVDTLSKSAAPSTSPSRGATNSNWSFLSLDACGVETYLKQHPTYDGRGTILAILDDGVDPGIAGLLETSEGKKKIIDVQDVAGTGDLYFEPAERNGDKIVFNGRAVLSGLDKQNLHPFDGKYFFANLSERKYQNGLGDLNFNDKRDDNFGVLVFQDTKDHWMAIIDGDGDGSLAGEKQLSNFKEFQDVFRFRAPSDADENDGRFLTGAINIYPLEHRINIYLADGGHGTHVAGIAGGNRIDGQTGFNGVAPGAQIIALKFADNTMDGVTVSGSMKRAYEYVIKVAQETGEPVIVNMSFGVGSELEGRSVMDEWLDSLLDAHPEVTVCIAAGNDGPGISNVGLPGSARTVITSGACLPDDTGRDLYGLKMTNPVIWDFSSRGAELAKPDIVSPGTAVSTVPDYVLGDRYNGTSMASPYTAGCCAVLISGMRQLFPDYKPNANDVKRALQLGAIPLPGMSILDEGAGLINVPNAFERLVDWQRSGFHPRQYTISVPIPSSVKKGTAAFYRNGCFPKNADRTVFTVTPIDPSASKTRDKLLSFNAFDLRSTAAWLEPVQGSVYRRGEGPFQVAVSYDPKQLQKPGMYCGKILAYPKGGDLKIPEFELWNTVIVPHQFNTTNNYQSEIRDIQIRPGTLRREFFAIPPGVKAVKVSMSSRGTGAPVDAIIVDNDGRIFSRVHLKHNESDESSSHLFTGGELEHGIWEIDVKRGIGSDDEEAFAVDLKVEAVVFDVSQKWLQLGSAAHATGRIELSNSGSTDLSLDYLRADVHGYERYIDTSITSGDTFTYRFTANPNENSASFYCTLSREDYNLFTDIAFQILKPDQSTAANGGFDLRNEVSTVSFSKNDTTVYTLKFCGGLANPQKSHPFRILIRERRELDSKSQFQINHVLPSASILYSGQTENISLTSQGIGPELPVGFKFYGVLSFKASIGTVELPLSFSP